MQFDLSEPEWTALREAAAREGLTPEQYAELAISAAIKARYVLPKSEGRVLAFGRRREGE